MIFNPSVDDVRQFFKGAWQRRLNGEILSPIEIMAADWIEEHPEYHAHFTSDVPAEEFTPEAGEVNPFLHVAMHLSITEQLSIDQPPGIRQATEQLARKLGSMHEAQHAVMDCLGEMLWKAQRDRTEPDGAAYVECVKRKASR